jgi:hypothetical protein
MLAGPTRGGGGGAGGPAAEARRPARPAVWQVTSGGGAVAVGIRKGGVEGRRPGWWRRLWGGEEGKRRLGKKMTGWRRKTAGCNLAKCVSRPHVRRPFSVRNPITNLWHL